VAEQNAWSDGGYFASAVPAAPPGGAPGQSAFGSSAFAPGQAGPGQPGGGQPFGQAPYAGPPVPGQYAPAGPPPGYGPAPYGAYYPSYAPPSRTDGFAIASLVCSLIFGLGSLFAVIFGHVSTSRSRREGRSSSGLAIAGLVLGYLGLLGIIAAIAIPVFLNQRLAGYDASVKSDLRNAATAEEQIYTSTGAFSTDVSQLNTTVAAGNRLVVLGATSSSVCIEGTSSRSPRVWYYSSTAGISTTPCY
jgi:hypothetical protein